MWSRVVSWLRAAEPAILKLSEIAKKVAMDLGLAEKKGDTRAVSAARALAVLWGITAVAVALLMVLVLGETDHVIVAELIAGCLAALGLRTRANGEKR